MKLGLILLAAWLGLATAQEPTTLSFDTDAGTLKITPLGHSSVRLELAGTVIHVDPWSQVADYSQQPDADWVLVTHEHSDHLDPGAIAEIATPNTRYLMDKRTAEASGLEGVTLVENGDTLTVGDFTVTAVPAYNVVRERDNGQKYHPKGWYNGFVLTVGDFKLHLAGDTECIPEFSKLAVFDDLTVSFLPINLPYTMPPEEAAACYRTLSPEVAVPYHQGDFDPQLVADRLADTDIDVKVLELP